MSNLLGSPFQLPCGVTISNRICKAAMTERLSSPDYMPNQKHINLYSKWADTGAGILITGNIMMDRFHMESAGNIILDQNSDHKRFKEWTAAATKNGNHIWAQLSHSGRQTTKFVNARPNSASDVQLKKMGLFGKPKPLTEEQIITIIDRFAETAKLTKETGFTGVQIHSAHGYLLSQFLSPRTNKREDQWGGSLENRSRLLKEIIRKVRKEVGEDFPISVKLNSADFQRGGFSEDDSLHVVDMLAKQGIDLLEISGGTYEKLAFFENKPVKESTASREAYFLEFANKVRNISTVPLMVTGGFRSSEFMEESLQTGDLDMIGLARPFINDVDHIHELFNGKSISFQSPEIKSPVKSLNDSAEGGYYARQLFRMAAGKAVDPGLSASYSSIWLVMTELRKALAKKL